MTATAASDPPAYDGFDLMPIAGEWRRGRAGKELPDHDPYRGDVLVTVSQADPSDVDEAYRGALRVQPAWAETQPAERATVMRSAAEAMASRREEITEWLTFESGSTAIKAEREVDFSIRDFLEASSYPYRSEGRMLPADVPGKESRVYRHPLGVIGCISPWNFPLHLSNRTVAPALALGNAVV
ncbi:MAG TPA: aldehyde dehydrogenase family protein, partial [Acidimicrobiales bacterium]|nr:aldehyde dehydrogenase family protein [Acidimicrobiales bacterium]